MRVRGFTVRVSVFYAAIFAGIGIHAPFTPVWLASQGFGAREIAGLLATMIATRVVAGPVVAFIADWIGDRRAPLIVLAALSFLATLAWAFTAGFWAVYLVGAALALVWTPAMPLLDAYTLGGSQRLGLEYGRIRLWGSASFIVASVVTGAVIKATSPGAVIWLLVAAQATTLAAAAMLPRDRLRRRPTARTGDRIRLSDATALVAAPLFLTMMAASSLTQATHAIYYGFGTLHWRSLGLGEDLIGTLWALGVIAEIALFAVSGKALARIGPAGLILAGAAVSVIRWGVTALDPPLWLLVIAQFGHAFTFGATFLGTIRFIGEAVPERLRTTGQGLYAAVASGLVMGGVTLVTGALYETLGAGAFLAMSAIGLIASGFALVLTLKWDGGELPLLAVRRAG